MWGCQHRVNALVNTATSGGRSFIASLVSLSQLTVGFIVIDPPRLPLARIVCVVVNVVLFVFR